MKPPVYNYYWPDDVKAVYHHDMQEMWDSSINPHLWNMYHKELELYCSLLDQRKKLRILDVGCAQATLALLLAEHGHSVLAMDIRQHFLDYAMTRYEKGDIQFICGNAMDMNWNEQFDVIFANQILEHLVYPLEFVQRLKNWLVWDGRLIMSTPNGSYVKNDLPLFSQLGEMANYEQLQYSADGDGHFFAYTAEELYEIASKAGFGKVEVCFFETPWITGHMKFRYLHKLFPVSLLSWLDRMTINLPLNINKKVAYQLLVKGTLLE